VRTPDGKVFVKSGQGLIYMWNRTSYDYMLFLTLPMAFTGDKTHDLMFAKPAL